MIRKIKELSKKEFYSTSHESINICMSITLINIFNNIRYIFQSDESFDNQNKSGQFHLTALIYIMIWNFTAFLIKTIDFYFPLFYYCLMTSADGNVT